MDSIHSLVLILICFKKKMIDEENIGMCIFNISNNSSSIACNCLNNT